MFDSNLDVDGGDDEPPPPPPAAKPKPPPSGGNVFVKPDDGSPFYVSRSGVLRSHRLKELLIKEEAAMSLDGRRGMLELQVPDVPAAALVPLMEHCERHAAQKPDAEATDAKLVDSLEVEALLQLTGAAHRLGISTMLGRCASRVAKLLREATAAPPGERAAVPLDLYLRPDPSDTLSDAEKLTVRDECLFTLPDDEHAANLNMPYVGPPAAKTADVRITPRATHGRYSGGLAQPPSSLEAALAATAAGAYGTPGTGDAGGGGTVAGIGAAGADALVKHLGGEAPLLAVLVRLDATSLRTLKTFGGRWKRRARTALCSGEWAEGVRAGSTLDLGRTRHWSIAERCSVGRFLSDGQCGRLATLAADGFEASLPDLLPMESVTAGTLLQAITTNPCTSDTVDDKGGGRVVVGAVTADGLAAQCEFCSLLALWLLGSSHSLREADFGSLTYSGLLPLRDALAPAVERASRRNLTTLIVSKGKLPVRDLVGMPPPPSPLARSGPPRATPAEAVELKWQRLGALDATLIAALLRANRSLVRLDLSWNGELSSAGSAGARELAEAIAGSRMLTDVNLSETSLGDGACDALCRAVSSNSALKVLNVASAGLTIDSREALERANRIRATPLDLKL